MSVQDLLKTAQGGNAGVTTPTTSSSSGVNKLLLDAQKSPSVSSQPSPISSPSPFLGTAAPQLTSFPGASQTSTAPTLTKPNVASAAFQGVTNALSAPAPASSFSNVYNGGALNAGAKVVTNSLTDLQNRIADSLNTFGVGGTPQGSATQKIAGLGSVGLGVVNTVFAPISGVIASFASIPGASIVADGINKVFGAIGGGASGGAEQAVDELPISESTKDAIRKPVGELAGLVAMITAGKVGFDSVPGMKAKVDEVATKLKVESQSIENKIPVTTPKTIFDQNKVNLPVKSLPSDYPNSMYTKPGDLPTIEMGPKAKDTSGLPTIQTESPVSNKLGDMTLEPIKPEPIFKKTASPEPVLSKTAVKSDIKTEQPLFTTAKTPGIPEEVKPIEVQGTGETKVRGLSAGVEAKAIENKLTTSLGDLPEYKTVSMKEQAQKATDLINSDPATAKSIAMGETPPPKGLLPESVFVAVEDKAVREGDVATLRDLASGSKLTGEATTMGQRIRTLAERDPDSPVKAIGDLVKSRREVAEKRTGNFEKAKKQVSEGVKSEIAKNKPTKETWSDFVTSLQC